MFLNKKYKWILIGDVHGCINDLKKLLALYGFSIINNKIKDKEESKKYGIVLLGDVIDKADDENLTETINFLFENKDIIGERLFLLEGNHERRVWQWLTNDKDLIVNERTIKQKEKYYNTSLLCERDNEIKDKFLFLFSKMIPFIENEKFIATHAPVEKKYLGKADNISWLKQIKSESRSKNKDIHLDELMPYIIEEASDNDKLHIFGHLSQEDVRKYKNKICIDTGCVYGNKLTSVVVNKDATLDYKQIKAEQAFSSNKIKPQLFSTVS
jgi:predicted phosphodiesterase